MSSEMKSPYEYSSGPSGYSSGPSGYSSGPSGYMPVPQQPPPSYGYSPAPPVLSQQSSSNVVVVNQPTTTPTTVHVVHTRANEYLILTVVMMVLCFLHGNLPAFVCLIPALCFSCVASSHNDSGDYEGAKKFGNAALWCNCGVFVYYVLLVMAGVAMVIVYFTVGFSWLVGTASAIGDITVPPITIPPITIPPVTFPPVQECYTDIWGTQHCTVG